MTEREDILKYEKTKLRSDQMQMAMGAIRDPILRVVSVCPSVRGSDSFGTEAGSGVVIDSDVQLRRKGDRWNWPPGRLLGPSLWL